MIRAGRNDSSARQTLIRGLSRKGRSLLRFSGSGADHYCVGVFIRGGDENAGKGAEAVP